MFNGALPSWALSMPGVLPTSKLVDKILRDLLEAEQDDERRLAQILGAGGEGKSTVIMQVAARLGAVHGWRILRPRSTAPPFETNWLASIEHPGQPIAVVIDNSDLNLDLLDRIDQATGADSGPHLHIVTAAREGDWDRAVRAWSKRHRRDLGGAGTLRPERHRLRGFSRAFAESIVGSWRKFGADFGRLDPKQSDHQIAEQMAQLAAGNAQSSLFGCLLDARFSPPMLVAHAREIALGLARIEYDGGRLIRAYCYIAAAEAAGFQGICSEVLADLLFLDDRAVWERVLGRIGDEVGVAVEGGAIVTRHPRIAAAMLTVLAKREISEQTGIADLGYMLSDIARQVIKTSARVFIGPTFNPTTNCGPRLGRRLCDTLGENITEPEAHRMAVLVAQAAMDDSIQARISCAEALVAAKRTDEAVQFLRQEWKNLPKLKNYRVTVRSYLLPWAVAEGQTHPYRSLWLVLLSISDEFEFPIRENGRKGPLYGARASLAGVGRALQLLKDVGKATWRSRGLAAVSTLGLLTDPDPTTLGYFKEHLRTAISLGHTDQIDVAQALECLAEVSALAHIHLADPFLESLGTPPLRFNILAATLVADEKH